jgi:glycerol kinase
VNTDTVLVIDVGTSQVRAAVLRADGSMDHVHAIATPPNIPFPGLVEFDARSIAAAVLEVAEATLGGAGPVAGVGIANQRASTLVWDRRTGEPVGTGLGWQDLRTVGTCLELQAEGFRFPPNASATKLAAILDEVDTDRTRAQEGLCFGTIDSWIAWVLSGGSSSGGVHVTDATNAAVTWLSDITTLTWDQRALDILRIPASMLPRIVDSSGFIAEASALTGSPPILGIAGDQQASLLGQGCSRPGRAKATFGSGGMLDMCTGDRAPTSLDRGLHGTFPIVAWQRGGRRTWGIEAMMLSAGTCVEWLRDDLGIIESASDSGTVARGCEDSGDVRFVPALLGLGTPVWDFGARGSLSGISAGTGRAQVVRAVLEGIAHRGADLLEAAETDGDLQVETLRIDGGMSANEVFVQALADATGRIIDIAPETEATTRGAGYLAGIAADLWRNEDAAAETYRPRMCVEPRINGTTQMLRRERWLEARRRAERTIPELSELSF